MKEGFKQFLAIDNLDAIAGDADHTLHKHAWFHTQQHMFLAMPRTVGLYFKLYALSIFEICLNCASLICLIISIYEAVSIQLICPTHVAY